jgi:hypothetical protein
MLVVPFLPSHLELALSLVTHGSGPDVSLGEGSHTLLITTCLRIISPMRGKNISYFPAKFPSKVCSCFCWDRVRKENED